MVSVHRQAGRQLTEVKPEPAPLLRATLEAAVAVLPEIDGGAIWLRDGDRDELAFADGVGPLWADAPAAEANRVRSKIFPLVPKPGRSVIQADVGLLEHALANLLDNARKYSYKNTTVAIGAGFIGQRAALLSVGDQLGAPHPSGGGQGDDQTRLAQRVGLEVGRRR